MQCPQCSAEVREDAAFCRECGAAIQVVAPETSCTNCGATLSPGAGFCRECGTAVGAAAPAGQGAGTVRPRTQRRGRPNLSTGAWAAISAGVLIVVVAVAGVFLLAGGGDDTSLPEPGPVDAGALESIQASIDALGEPDGATERDQMRSLMGRPDAFSITEDVDEAGNVSRREEWFYYEIRTVFEYADGKLVSNLPIESSYGGLYIAPIQYEPDDFELGVTWDEVASTLPDPEALTRGDLEPEYGIAGYYYAGDQLLLFFDDNDRLIYVEAIPLTPGEEPE